MKKILNCPYCKGVADTRIVSIGDIHSSKVYVECTMCGAKGPCYVCDDTKLIYHAMEAEDLWNMVARRRTND